MKSFYCLLTSLALFTFSCSEILDVEAENAISGDVLTDAESIQKALNGAYYNFSGMASEFDGGELMGGDFILIPVLLARVSSIPQEIRWESVNASRGYLEFLNKEILATNDRVAANWRRAYETINSLNSILASLDKVEDPDVKTRIQGESLAMRGILYYQMVLLWGPHYDASTAGTDPAIPIRTEAIQDISEIPVLSASDLNTVQEVYDQAEKDLTDASVLLKDFEKNGTNLSYYACEAFLARLYLQQGKYNDAAEHATNVIESGQFELTPTPMEAFNNRSNSSEDIFAIQQTLANNTGDRSSGIGITTYFSSLTESGLGTLGILKASFNSSFLVNTPDFSEEDLRATVKTDVDDNTASADVTTAYYQNIANNFEGLLSSAKYTSTINVLPVLRLAEMYLIRAEAAFESSGGNLTQPMLDDLGSIRTRANLPGLMLSDFPDQEAFFDSLAIERTREFMHEGLLLHDLKRWGGYIGGGNLDPWDDQFVLPVPQSETDTWSD